MNVELFTQKKCTSQGRLSRHPFRFIIKPFAAFIHQKANQLIHDAGPGPTMQGPALTLLRNQASPDQVRNVMRQRRSRYFQAFLNAANCQPRFSGTDQQPENRESGWISQFIQTFCSIINIHKTTLSTAQKRVKYISMFLEL